MRVEHRKYTKGYFENGNFVEKLRQDIMLPDRSFRHLKKNESAEIYSQFEEIVDLGTEKLRLVSAGEFKADYSLYGKINGELTDEDYNYFLETTDLEKQSAIMQMGGWALTSSNACSHCLVEMNIPEIPEGVYVPTANDLRLKFKYFDLVNDQGYRYLSISLKKGLLLSEINEVISKLKTYLGSNHDKEFNIDDFLKKEYGHVHTEDFEGFCAFIEFIKDAQMFDTSTFEGGGNQPH